jgi:hypothetical protein
MQQLSDGWIGKRRMRNDELLRRKTAWISRVKFGCGAKKSDLEAELFFVGGLQPAG